MKAVIYARFSPRPKARVEACSSIEVQVTRCRDYCKGFEYELADEHVFADSEASGANTDRPGLEAAIKVACRLKAVLIVYSLSRLARNTADALMLAERLSAAGAHLAMLDTRIDTSTPVGRCFYAILAAITQLEREQTAERTKEAMLHQQANGRRVSDRLPFGLMEDEASDVHPHNGRSSWMVPCSEEQAIIARMVELRGRKFGYRAIGRRLVKENLLCRGGAWHHGTIKSILSRAGVR